MVAAGAFDDTASRGTYASDDIAAADYDADFDTALYELFDLASDKFYNSTLKSFKFIFLNRASRRVLKFVERLFYPHPPRRYDLAGAAVYGMIDQRAVQARIVAYYEAL